MLVDWVSRAAGKPGKVVLVHGDPDQGQALSRLLRSAVAVEQRVVSEEERIGRNDPCWCGSGMKYKKCHGANA